MSELDDFSVPLTPAPPVTKPSSPLDDFSMPVSIAQQKASVFSNSSPDEAGKALSISKQTGIPASIVQTDLPGYDAHAKTQAAIEAVKNPAIAKYIDENRMAPQVSNDDYGHMDEVSQYFENLKQDQIHAQATGGIIRGIPEIVALTQTAPGREKLLNALTQLPGAIGQGILDFFQTPGKVASGEINLTTPEGLDKGIGFGLGLALGSRDIRVGRAADAAIGPSGNVDDFLAKVRGAQTRQEINDFIKSKATAEAPKQFEGPKDLSAGATPVDELWQTKLNEAKANTAGEALDSAIEASQESTTKERSPELYEKFIEAHGDTGTVHVPAQAILDLYQREGKVPMAGDGLFGFVPGLAEKATLAAETGAEVAIPMPKYIANVDPTVHEGLKDVVRVHPDGVTREEAKLAKEEQAAKIEAYHGTPHDFENFDLAKIGTGEGAQVYGHGLYFAENKTVGADYAKNLGLSSEKTAHQSLIAAKGNRAQAIENLLDTKIENGVSSFGETKEMINDAIKLLQSGKEITKPDNAGQLYKVHINADPTHFLDWDKPLSEQPEVQQKLKKLDIEYGPFNNDTIKDIYRTISARAGSEEAASKALVEAGIPGIKYLDQGSRGAGDGTRNFVVFDDKLVKIIEKNDNPIVQAAVERTVREKQSLYLEPLFRDGEALGITQSEFKRYSDLIDRGQEAVLTKAVALAKREAAKRLTPEWKANEDRIRSEVESEITKSPVYLADQYFNFDKGMLPNGKRVIHTHFETMDLVQADQFAPHFGFESGSDMSTAVVAREQARVEAGKGPKWQLKQEVEAETARRMEAQYGNLADNIALEASDAALAEWNVDLLAAEWRMLAKLNGRDPPLSREQLKDWAKNQFDRSIASQVSYEQWRRASEKGGREAEKALLKKDYEEAFIAKQHQMLALILAKEAKIFEKEKARIDSKIDRFTSEQVIKSIDQEHLEQIRNVLESVGVDQRYEPSQALEPIQNFVADSEGQIAIAPWLRGELPEGMKKIPSIDDMTVQQFRDLGKSLQSMEHVGRLAKTLSNARGAAELQNVVFDAKAELDRFNFIDQPMNPSKGQRLTSLGRKVTGAHLLVERMFDYTDQFNPHGPITEYLDRPLRDSNVKELILTEQVTKKLRDLRQHTDASVNDKIENNLIPDAMDKTGFANMRRTNLRQLMLYTGDRVRMAKVSEGFGINEADVRRFIDKNATASDVAWVNGVWDIFAGLKPEADAMQTRDTGVPVDSTPAVPWEVKAGKLTGGYYPIVYDKANSNIQGHLAAKNPVFDQHYVQATTPHGYTQSVTEFKGALDLSGSFLPSRIQGMIHDIAFREAIRNANKLISNQEFRTALAQKWGKEYSDLLPSWLKDIANSHTLDDDYAQGFVRGMALVRQNVISTLIAYNPGTFIKHGFTALLLSMDRVGGVEFTKALNEIGLKGAGETAKNLVTREDRVPDEAFMDSFRDSIDQGERGENARKFVLDSSAVMRNRQRQADDSIRGAVDRMNKAGLGQSAMNLRDQQMMLGRFMVAFSDGISAYPTWLAAYKKAYMAGEEHVDAVFIADKEVSRAHGSNFVGDQPLVTRIKNGPTGELARWFVPLYKFWNHMVNNNFQLAWDSAAALRGPAEGTTAEPGANAWAISRRVGLILATIFIEEQASAAKDEDHHGFLTKMALASLRYFGSGIVGVRELTNGLASGYEPSTGLLGTLGRGVNDTVQDLKRATGLKAGVAKNWIIHTATALGYLTGVGGTQVGKTGQFTKDLMTGQERPQTFNDYRQGFRTGHSKARMH